MVDGSHRAGLATPLGGTIPSDVVAHHQADARSLALPARAGEAILIHNYLWHCSRRNTTERPRRAFTVTYMPASTQCARRRRTKRSFTRVFDVRRS